VLQYLLAAASIASLISAGMVIRLSIKGRLAVGNWDIPIAMLLVLLAVALAAAAGAWRAST